MNVPPIGSLKATEPFMNPIDQPHLATDRPEPSDLSGTEHSVLHRQVTNKLPRDHQQD